MIGIEISKLKKYFRLIILPTVIILGCTTFPTQEMSDARQAVQAARELGATTYASENLNKAEMLLDQAKKALDTGNYEEARGNAVAAKSEAVKARNKALEAKPLL